MLIFIFTYLHIYLHILDIRQAYRSLAIRWKKQWRWLWAGAYCLWTTRETEIGIQCQWMDIFRASIVKSWVSRKAQPARLVWVRIEVSSRVKLKVGNIYYYFKVSQTPSTLPSLTTEVEERNEDHHDEIWRGTANIMHIGSFHILSRRVVVSSFVPTFQGWIWYSKWP